MKTQGRKSFGSCLAEWVLPEVLDFIPVSMSVASFGFLQMQMEDVLRQALELRKPDLG